MKIERINDNQIRCTLTAKDLAARKIKVSELAYGSRKARSLFEEMMHQAEEELGFTADDLPLMIEAIPINADCIVFIITRVEDPEELDTRFSKFMPQVTREEDDEEDDEEEISSTSFDDFLRRALGAEEVTEPVTVSVAFRFASLNDLILLANSLPEEAPCDSALYKDEASHEYILYLPALSDDDTADIERFCGLLSDFGTPDRSLRVLNHHTPGYECLIPVHALSHLKEL
ncbi:MAG: adaptor protein MecA [Lachnospiraceae bacterium]|nr:adaptor protein MecA [Lachnospiraceae bacterium]